LCTNTLGCASCHGDHGQGGRGPELINLMGKEVQFTDGVKQIADDAYIRESILNPTAHVVQGFQPIMPTFQGQVSEEQLLQLLAFVHSLSAQPAAPTASPGGAQHPAGPTVAPTPAAPATRRAP
jgi:cytochrome c oxidase subunit II